jgi:hypothetical protein
MSSTNTPTPPRNSSGPVSNPSPRHRNITNASSAPPIISLPSNKKYHGFLTHNWQEDEEGRNNHARVERVHLGLKKRGLNMWFDSERMTGAIVDQMIKGIDESDLVIVFITKKYADKVASGNPKDNCKKEFDYTSRVKGANKMIPVPMEPCMGNPGAWVGPVQMELGGMLYEASFPTDDDVKFEENIDNLFKQIVRETSGVVMTENARAVLEKEIENRLKEEMKKKEIVKMNMMRQQYEVKVQEASNAAVAKERAASLAENPQVSQASTIESTQAAALTGETKTDTVALLSGNASATIKTWLEENSTMKIKTDLTSILSVVNVSTVAELSMLDEAKQLEVMKAMNKLNQRKWISSDIGSKLKNYLKDHNDKLKRQAQAEAALALKQQKLMDKEDQGVALRACGMTTIEEWLNVLQLSGDGAKLWLKEYGIEDVIDLKELEQEDKNNLIQAAKENGGDRDGKRIDMALKAREEAAAEEKFQKSKKLESDIIARVEAAANKITKNYDWGVYYGQMEGGKIHGYGTRTVADGNKYVGELKNDKMHGYGTYTWASGNKYVGELKNDKQHGQGTKTLANGTIEHSGEWVNNKPKK